MTRRALWIAAFVAIGSCTSHAPAAARLPPPARTFIADTGEMAWRSRGVDAWEVWICEVPGDATSTVFSPSPRVPLRPEAVAAAVSRRVTPYFVSASNGQYTPEFRAGGTVSLAADQEPAACVDDALRMSDDTARGVLVVSTAEHRADRPGAWSNGGNGGNGCETPCPASTSRRNVYIGAADFNPIWGGDPPMDLIEHEIGHALGWWHSAYDESLPTPYRSAIDVMSNSAAPQDTDGGRRDAPLPIAAHRVLAGWERAGTEGVVDLAERSAVAAIDDSQFVSVELRRRDGYDSHLPHDGVAIHLVDVSSRTITPVHTDVEPYDDLLDIGDSARVGGLTLTVMPGWMVDLGRASE